MRTNTGKLATCALLWAMSVQTQTVLAQGSLTPPPGPPQPTMKTLTQVEPRIAITNTGAFTISQPGSYYLTTNINVTSGDGITINATEVSLDLAGFTISSTANPAAGNGIFLKGAQNITIRNGFIRGGVTNSSSDTFSGPGFASGVLGNYHDNVKVTGISVMGCMDYGIYLGFGPGEIVESCTVTTVSKEGIKASIIRSCGTSFCGQLGILGVSVQNCTANNSWKSGIKGSVVASCYAWGSIGIGIDAESAVNCSGTSGSGVGLLAMSANNCDGYSSGNIGMVATNALNCRGTSTSAYYGLIAGTAEGCTGKSYSGFGLSAITAINCVGVSTTADGLNAVAAQNCQGRSGAGVGLSAEIAQNCSGYSTNGSTGLRFSKIGSMCYGTRGSPAASNYVLGAGLAGPIDLP